MNFHEPPEPTDKPPEPTDKPAAPPSRAVKAQDMAVVAQLEGRPAPAAAKLPPPPLTPRQLVDLWRGRAADQHVPTEQRTMYSLCADGLKLSLDFHAPLPPETA